MSSVYGLNVPNDWEVVALDQIKSDEKKALISGPFGSNISAKYFTPTGVPVIRGNNLSLDVFTRFKENGFVFVSPEKADELGTWAQADDIIFTAVGTLGQIGLLSDNQDYPRYIISNKQIRLRLNQEKVTPQFVYYWLASDLMQEVIEQRNTGSSVPLINLGVVKSLLIPLPPLPEQKAIASVLSSLDDKIDLLHRQNKTLEAMAETLFRQWFIEEAIEDWEELSVSDIALHVKDNVNPSKDPLGTFYHFSLPAFDSGQKPTRELGSEILSNKYRVSKNSILVSKLNPRVPRIWLVSNVEDNYVCSTEFQNLKPKVTAHLMFLYSLFNSRDVIDELTMSASGTSGSHQRVKPEDMLNITFRTPSLDYLEQYSSLIAPSMQKVASNKQQIQTLENLRDTLLPKLMSGEVRVQYQTEEVA
ncbi:restriction endonuclease subunit S [Acinetobacter variabilis]|uniref:restriction endonuclease subunit S n=1 Tax=Acinetobacter variabilis TaxID=70346 RepID=UPI003AF63E96